MGSVEIKRKTKEKKGEDTGTALDNPKLDPKTMLAALVVLILLAIILSMLPQILKRPTNATTGSAEIPASTNVSNTTPGTVLSNIDLENLSNSINILVCNQSLLPSNEKDSYVYTISYDPLTYPAMQGQTSIMQSNFSSSAEGFVRKVSTATSFGSMEMLFYYYENMSCNKGVMNMTVNNQTISQEVPCAQGSDRLEICAENVNKTGDERITVGAGTFDTRVYLSVDNSTTFWIANSSEISVPVKMVSQGMTMELSSFNKWK